MMEFDVIVLGTGAAGLTAAIAAAEGGAAVGVFEKADRVGGTSAWSGVWIPDNPHMMRAPTLEALADTLGIPGDELVRTVARWNANCAAGCDPDFGRGESAFDRWWGDPYRKGTKEATLGPLVRGPYYAVEVCSGALGTKGGPQTDAVGNVVDIDGQPIPGLYAAGNVMASPFGMTYGGPGGTLGPGMVFGFLAGRHAAARLTNR